MNVWIRVVNCISQLSNGLYYAFFFSAITTLKKTDRFIRFSVNLNSFSHIEGYIIGEGLIIPNIWFKPGPNEFQILQKPCHSRSINVVLRNYFSVAHTFISGKSMLNPFLRAFRSTKSRQSRGSP